MNYKSSPVTIGKRGKYICFPADNTSDKHYFKLPITRYHWEFWSEVAASKIGQLLEFDIADYNVAYNEKGEIGCLSKSIFQSGEELFHGQQYLLRLKPNFHVKDGRDHSYQLIKEFFESYTLTKPLFKNFIEMLVFDAVVGNHDRHQQNWALVRSSKDGGIIFWARWLWRKLTLKDNPNEPIIKLRFSKIFDSGNCLAYNYSDEKIKNDLIYDQQKFENFVIGEKAVCHINWQNQKMKYVDLLYKIMEDNPNEIKSAVGRVIKNYDEVKVATIIDNLDCDFPFDEKFWPYRLSLDRKEIFKKLIKRRVELLRPILQK
ncbi:MAG: hypothetical protein U0T73_11845 [Chitinophagales bacterium]